MWLTVAVGLSTLVLSFLLWVLEMKRRYRCIAHYPGPKGMFLLGNALDLGRNPVEVLENTRGFMKQYGKYVQIWVGPNRPFLWISDVKFMEYILSSTRHINKSKDYSFLHQWLGGGLLVAGGEKWKKRRKILTPAFHFKVLEQFVEVFNNCGQVLIEKLSKEVDKDCVDIYPYITLYTLDTICETAMGTSINAQINSNSEYVQAVKNACTVLIERTFSAWKQFDIPFMFSNTYKTQTESLRILHGFTASVIAKKKEELAKEEEEAAKNRPKDQEEEEFSVLGIKKRMAFLDLLLKSTYDGYDGDRLSDEDIREEVDTFMFEGHDTTASAISFTLYEISKHPEVQKKIIEELDTIFTDDRTRPVAYKDLTAMKYMELVIKESLRLYPSVPFYAREIKEDLIYDGVTLPAGLTVTLYPMVMHRNPEIFEDPETFKPERFLPENTREKSPYSYLPFSAGLRNCIGQKFAMMEMKATLCKILRNFELSSVTGHELILSAEVVLKSASGICIRLKKRNSDETQTQST